MTKFFLNYISSPSTLLALDANKNVVNSDPTAFYNINITGSAGTASPIGPAGGSLSGTYPNPSIANLAVTNSMLFGGITASKLVGTDIDVVGTINTGVWEGTPISPAYFDYNVTNLQITAGQLNTIQDIDTLAIPTFLGLTLSGLSAGQLVVTDISSELISGNLSGDITTSGNLVTTLATVNSNVGTFGDASHSITLTANGKGLLTAISSNSIQISESQVTNLISDLAAKLNLSGGTMTGNLILNADATFPLQAVTFQQLNAAVVGVYKLQGGYDPTATSLYPVAADTTNPVSAIILQGMIWSVTVNGIVNGNAVTVGDQLLALIDSPGQTDANWSIINNTTNFLPSSNIFVGNASNIAVSVVMSGDVGIDNAGVTTIQNLAVTNAKIANTTIDLTTKVIGVLPNANTTSTSLNVINTIIERNGSGDFSAGTITATLNGLSNNTLQDDYDNGTGIITTVSGKQLTINCDDDLESPVFISATTNAGVIINSSASSSDTKNWMWSATSGGNFDGLLIDDALTSSVSWMQVNRTGMTVNFINFPTGTLQYGGSEVATKSYVTSQLNSFTGTTNIVTVGTVTTGTWSGLFGAVSGANLTNLTAANISAGTAGINISGNAATVTTNANLTGDVTSIGNATTLATVNSNVGSFGSSTQVSTFTVNAKGLITAASNVTISGVAPGGSASGDLSGTYPSPTVSKINGVALGTTTATSGNILIGSGTTWDTQSVSGDITLGSTGVTAIGASKVTNTMLAGSITDSKLNTISTAGKVLNSATTATNANTASAIVARDASGNFIAGTITASLSGNATTATTATNADNVYIGATIGPATLYPICAPSISSGYQQPTLFHNWTINPSGDWTFTTEAGGSGFNFINDGGSVYTRLSRNASTDSSKYYFSTNLTDEWSVGQPASATTLVFHDETNNVNIFTLTKGTGTSSTGVFAGNVSANNLSGTNTGNVTISGQNYLTISSQIITANAVDLSGSNATGILAAGRFPALSGDVSTSSGSLTTAIGANKVTLAQMAQMATASFLGRNTAATGNVEVLSEATAKTMLNLSGTNSGDVTFSGENYITLSGQALTAAAVNLSGTNATGILAAARFPALTGDVTTSSGSLSTTIAALAVTNAKIANTTIDLITKVTGILPIGNGGSGNTAGFASNDTYIYSSCGGL